jgi:hypothetical protein
MKRDGTRISAPASPRQQWVVEMWNNGNYEGYKLFPSHEEAQQFADNYSLMLAEFREQRIG